MDLWVVPIGNDRPENWGLGRDSLLWATPKKYPINAGDSLLFYQARPGNQPGLMVGRAVATSGPEPVVDRGSLPWKDGVDYRWRYQLDSVEDADPAFEVEWATIKEFLGQGGAPQAPRRQYADFVRVPVLVEFAAGIKYPSTAADAGGARRRAGRVRSRSAANRRIGVRRRFQPADETAGSRSAEDETVVQVRTTTGATNRHNATLNELAAAVETAGGTALETEGQSFGPDLIWRQDGAVHVAEVKSLDDVNQIAQLRLGLGQVLQYRNREGVGAVAWLVAQYQPEAASEWDEICSSVGVKLWWPGRPV